MRTFLLLFVFPALCALAHSHAETPASYQLITEIPIGGEGGWDILTIDSAARRLYLSHATKVVVVDLEKNAVVGEITDTPGVHGVCSLCRNWGAAFRPTAKKTKRAWSI